MSKRRMRSTQLDAVVTEDKEISQFRVELNESIAYLKESCATLEEFSNDDDRRLFAAKLFEEGLPKANLLAADQRGSKALETLLNILMKNASQPLLHVSQMLDLLSPHIVSLSANQYGSHVIQKLINFATPILSKADGETLTAYYDALDKIWIVLSSTGEAAQGSASVLVDMACHASSTHVLRTLILASASCKIPLNERGKPVGVPVLFAVRNKDDRLLAHIDTLAKSMKHQLSIDMLGLVLDPYGGPTFTLLLQVLDVARIDYYIDDEDESIVEMGGEGGRSLFELVEQLLSAKSEDLNDNVVKDELMDIADEENWSGDKLAKEVFDDNDSSSSSSDSSSSSSSSSSSDSDSSSSSSDSDSESDEKKLVKEETIESEEPQLPVQPNADDDLFAICDHPIVRMAVSPVASRILETVLSLKHVPSSRWSLDTLFDILFSRSEAGSNDSSTLTNDDTPNGNSFSDSLIQKLAMHSIANFVLSCALRSSFIDSSRLEIIARRISVRDLFAASKEGIVWSMVEACKRCSDAQKSVAKSIFLSLGVSKVDGYKFAWPSLLSLTPASDLSSDVREVFAVPREDKPEKQEQSNNKKKSKNLAPVPALDVRSFPHLSIKAVGCSLIQSLLDFPANCIQPLLAGFRALLDAPSIFILNIAKHPQGCRVIEKLVSTSIGIDKLPSGHLDKLSLCMHGRLMQFASDTRAAFVLSAVFLRVPLPRKETMALELVKDSITLKAVNFRLWGILHIDVLSRKSVSEWRIAVQRDSSKKHQFDEIFNSGKNKNASTGKMNSTTTSLQMKVEVDALRQKRELEKQQREEDEVRRRNENKSVKKKNDGIGFSMDDLTVDDKKESNSKSTKRHDSSDSSDSSDSDSDEQKEDNTAFTFITSALKRPVSKKAQVGDSDDETNAAAPAKKRRRQNKKSVNNSGTSVVEAEEENKSLNDALNVLRSAKNDSSDKNTHKKKNNLRR